MMTAAKLCATLKQKRLTQAAFAREIGRTPRTVNRWCTGAIAVPAWVAVYLANRKTA